MLGASADPRNSRWLPDVFGGAAEMRPPSCSTKAMACLSASKLKLYRDRRPSFGASRLCLSCIHFCFS